MVSEEFSELAMLAWSGKMEFGHVVESASKLELTGKRPLAAILYQTWVRKTPSPYLHVGWFNLGVTLVAENDLKGAEEAYRQALLLQETFTHPRVNLGLVYERQGQIDRAIEEWRWIDRNISPDDSVNRSMLITAINHIGRTLESRRQYGDAIVALERSLSIEPDQTDVLHHWVFLREKCCCWPIYVPIAGVDETVMREATSALAMLSLSDDPAEQLVAAKRYVAANVRSDVTPLADASGYDHKRIRIAYLSSDFCLHPVSMLTVHMFELHDRSRFEVFGYCWSPEDGSTMRKRVIDAMDHFTRIDKLSDEAAARLIREHEIDVLVDLQGQTAGARANLLAHRPAPIQITYLGLPATTGLPSIDYVIADPFLIPEAEVPFYSEKPLYMPDVYQVSDRVRSVGPIPTREGCGLPADVFVYCSLNNNNKYTPEIFDAWMRILKQVPNGVLWLLADNPWSEANLRKEAEARGIGPDRLYFAGRVSPEDYLARFAVADLFLDTFPFNAGTTANDALFAGLPVLTLAGRTFASRMAGALLTAAELPELITYRIDDYERKAVSLATNPDEYRQIRDRLEMQRDGGKLFDTARFTRSFEMQLEALVDQLPGAK